MEDLTLLLFGGPRDQYRYQWSACHKAPDLERAFSDREIIRWAMKDLNLKPEEVGLGGSATRAWKLHKAAPKRRGEVVTGSPQSLVEHLIRKLEALSILDEESGNE
ncbi:hypothetical protein ES703_97424 [subsurface metagenome]